MKRNEAFFPWQTFVEAAQRGGKIGARLGTQSALVWTVAYLFVHLGTQLSIVESPFSKEIDAGTFYDLLYPAVTSFVGFVILGSVPVGVLSFGLGCAIGGVSVLPYIGKYTWVRSLIAFGLVLMVLILTFPLLRPILEADMWLHFPVLTALLMLNAIFLSGGAIWLSVWLPIGMCDIGNKETPVGERPVAYSTLWLRFLRTLQGRTF